MVLFPFCERKTLVSSIYSGPWCPMSHPHTYHLPHLSLSSSLALTNIFYYERHPFNLDKQIMKNFIYIRRKQEFLCKQWKQRLLKTPNEKFVKILGLTASVQGWGPRSGKAGTPRALKGQSYTWGHFTGKVPMSLSQIDITVIFFDSTVKDTCPLELIVLVHEYIRQVDEAE